MQPDDIDASNVHVKCPFCILKEHLDTSEDSSQTLYTGCSNYCKGPSICGRDLKPFAGHRSYFWEEQVMILLPLDLHIESGTCSKEGTAAASSTVTHNPRITFEEGPEQV